MNKFSGEDFSDTFETFDSMLATQYLTNQAQAIPVDLGPAAVGGALQARPAARNIRGLYLAPVSVSSFSSAHVSRVPDEDVDFCAAAPPGLGLPCQACAARDCKCCSNFGAPELYPPSTFVCQCCDAPKDFVRRL